MTTLGELLKEPPRAGAEKAKPALHIETSVRAELRRGISLREEQIHSLVEQLFFRHESGPIRRAGFSAIEGVNSTAQLCVDVAKTLAGESKYEVGLIDAGFGEPPLAARAQIPTPSQVPGPWLIAPRFWLAPRESWCPETSEHPANSQNLERLRELAGEFDFCVVHCPPASWLAAKIGHCCDGLVLVLTANRTRRMVVTQVRDRLNKLQVPVLGTVLTERRFPVPEGLYRGL